MPRGSKRKANPKSPSAKTRIARPSKIREKRVCFNLNNLYCSHPVFSYDDRESQYFCKVLERLKSVSMMTRTELMGQRSRTLKVHPIDFAEERVSEDTFGLGEDADNDAFQLNVSANEHGRIHGYFIENIFYIVWLDPEHKLYPRRRT